MSSNVRPLSDIRYFLYQLPFCTYSPYQLPSFETEAPFLEPLHQHISLPNDPPTQSLPIRSTSIHLHSTPPFEGNKSLLKQKLSSWNPFTIYSDYQAMSARLKTAVSLEAIYAALKLTCPGLPLYILSARKRQFDKTFPINFIHYIRIYSRI